MADFNDDIFWKENGSRIFLFTFALSLLFAVSAEEEVKVGVAGLARVTTALQLNSTILKQ